MSNKIYGKDIGKEKARAESADPGIAPFAMALQAHALAQTLLAYYASNRAWPPQAGPVPYEAPWNPWAASYFAPSPYYGTTGYPYAGGGQVPGFAPGQACAGAAGCCGTFAPRTGAGTPPSWVSPWTTPAASPWTTSFAPPWAAQTPVPWGMDPARPWATLAVPPWVAPSYAVGVASPEDVRSCNPSVLDSWRHFFKY